MWSRAEPARSDGHRFGPPLTSPNRPACDPVPLRFHWIFGQEHRDPVQGVPRQRSHATHGNSVAIRDSAHVLFRQRVDGDE